MQRPKVQVRGTAGLFLNPLI